MEKILFIDQIVGDSQGDSAGLVPVSRSTWYRGVKSGFYPKPVQISPGRFAWRKQDITELLQKLGGES